MTDDAHPPGADAVAGGVCSRKRIRTGGENDGAEEHGGEAAAAAAAEGAGEASTFLPPRAEFDDAPGVRRGAGAELGALRRRLAEGGAILDEATGQGGGSVDGEDGDAEDEQDGPDEGYEGPPAGGEYGRAQQLPEEDEEERMLLRLPSLSASFVAGGTAAAEDGFSDVRGDVVVTTRRLFFVAAAEADNRDLAIDAGCVSLHAVSSEGIPGRCADETAWHVYCQLTGGGCHDADVGGHGGDGAVAPRGIDPMEPDLESGDGDADDSQIGTGGGGDDSGIGGGPTEVYFAPLTDGGERRAKDRCQRLFDALSRMAALNPIFDDDDEYGGGGGGGGGLSAMMSLMEGLEGNGHTEKGVVAGQDEEDGDGDGEDYGNEELVFRIGDGDNNDPYRRNEDGDESEEGATMEEREAMLQRLDAMLVVPKELEIHSDDEGAEGGGDGNKHVMGQFDDAEE